MGVYSEVAGKNGEIFEPIVIDFDRNFYFYVVKRPSIPPIRLLYTSIQRSHPGLG